MGTNSSPCFYKTHHLKRKEKNSSATVTEKNPEMSQRAT